MAKTLKEIFQEYLDMPESNRISLAKTATAKIHDYFQANLPAEMKKDEATIYMMIIGTFLGADGQVSEREVDFFKKMGLNLDYNTFFAAAKAAMTVETINFVDELIDGSGDVKAAFVILGCCICAADGTMTVDEQALISKYLN